MFDNLIESKRDVSLKGLLSGGAFSITVHVVGILLAIYATLHAGEVVADKIQQVNLAVAAPDKPKNEPPPPPDQVATVNPPPKGFQTLSIPTTIPVDIPPPTQNTNFNAADFSGVGVEGGIAKGVEGGTGPVISDQPYLEAVVEERPETIAGTCVLGRYPEILRQAGVEGTVMVEFVVDTLGRAERGSVRIVRSTQALFEPPARETVFTCRFRPGRIQGRAVRVRVQVPINFTINR